MGSDRRPGLFRVLIPALVVTGAYWLLTALAGEANPLVAVPGSLSILVAGLLLTNPRRRYVRSLTVATVLYDFILYLAQAYGAYGLLGSGLSVFGSVALAGYGAATGVFLFLLLGTFSHTEHFAAQPVGESTPRKD